MGDTLSITDNGQNTLGYQGYVPPGSVWDRSTSINEALWSKTVPYQLVVLEADDYGYTQKTAFTLPINPESLVRGAHFAIETEATLGGVVEQHGGKKFEEIQFQGSFGVLHSRPLATDLGMADMQGIAGGTVDAASRTADSITSLIPGMPQYDTNLIADDIAAIGYSGIEERTSGYYQFLALQRFLEEYVEAKKTEKGRRLRLAFFVWKEEAAYLVTPRVFQVTKSVDRNPHEYRYTLSLKAWRRIGPGEVSNSNSGSEFVWRDRETKKNKTGPRDILNRIQKARRVLANVRALAKASLGDMERTVLGTLRETALFLKDATATAKTIVDYPDAVQKLLIEDARVEWDRVVAAAKQFDRALQGRFDEDSYDFLSAVRTDTMPPLRESTRRGKEDEERRCRDLTPRDHRNARDELLEFAARFADHAGLGHDAYDRALGRNRGKGSHETADDDLRALFAMVDAADAIGSLIPTRRESKTLSTIEYVAGALARDGITMRIPRSKYAVPFPYGYTLEKLALEYLGDATRWLEIAALNELRAPYVDEEGLTQPLLVNGYGHEVAVEHGDWLTIGQIVRIESATFREEKRQVVNIRKVSAGCWVVTLSGESNLDNLKVEDLAKLRSFRHGTVNSRQVIFIPSDVSSGQDIDLRYTPQVEDLDQLLAVGGVDGALTESGDIALTPDGDWAMTQGIQTLVQWARVALSTPRRSMLLHPAFGIDVEVGQSIADFSAQELLDGIKSTFRFNDAFTGVRSAVVRQDGPGVSVSLELGVRGVDSLLPVTFPLLQ